MKPVRPGPRFARAVEWASALHAGQTKKGADTPYVAHLLGVAALVLDHGGSETEAIAALLHDSIEDAGVSPKQIRRRFGAKVARIVVGCTDVKVRRQNARRRALGSGARRRTGRSASAAPSVTSRIPVRPLPWCA